MYPEGREWAGILGTITAPAILFGLVFLVIPAGTALTLWTGDYDTAGSLAIAAGGGFLFLVALLLLAVLTWFRPQGLMYSERAYLAESQLRYGSKDAPASEDTLGVAKLRGAPIQVHPNDEATNR